MRNVGAWKIFWHQQKKMHSFNVVSWNVMLNVYAVHGYGKKRFVNLGWMCQETVEIHVAMFVCTQTLWNHASKPRRWMPMRLWFHGFNLHLSPLQLTIIVAYLLLVVMIWSWWGRVWQPRQAYFFLKMRTYETSILVSRAMLKLSNSMQNYEDCQHKWKMLPLWLDRIFLADVKWRGEHYHSEKLTTAFGLVDKSFVVLWIIKNVQSMWRLSSRLRELIPSLWGWGFFLLDYWWWQRFILSRDNNNLFVQCSALQMGLGRAKELRCT